MQELMYFLIIGGIYFLPAIQAYKRKHQNRSAITLLNAFAGWTGIGWVISIVWAYTNNCEEYIETE